MVEPQGARANSWEDVADLSARAGITLDPWQETILRASMGERSDQTWAGKRVGVSVGRQNGKSQLLVSRALAGALLFGEKKIVISAHMADTARESFGKMMEIVDADDNQWLRDRLKPNGVMNAINREALKFRNGAVIQFKARTGAGGRGFSSDCLMLDEAQRLKRSSWVSINSTMSAMPNPQVWLLGTPPTPEDDGDVFESIRSAAMQGGSGATAWAEWGADSSSDEYMAVMRRMRAGDRSWGDDVARLCWSANPAWNARMNVEVVAGEFESYTPEEFALDRLGVWGSDMTSQGAISGELWRDLGVESKPEGVAAYGVAFSMDGMRVSVGGCVLSGDIGHVELIDASDGHGGLRALADWFCEKDDDGVQRWRKSAGIVISGASGAGVLRQLLLERRVSERRIRVANLSQYLQSCVMFADAVSDKKVSHLDSEGQLALDQSVMVADKDKRGGWMSVSSDGDETPIEAVSLALWGARTSKKKSGEKRKAVII